MISIDERVKKFRLRIHRAARMLRAGFAVQAARLFDREYDFWFEQGDGRDFCRRLNDLYLAGGIFAEDCRTCQRWVPGSVTDGEGWR